MTIIQIINFPIYKNEENIDPRFLISKYEQFISDWWNNYLDEKEGRFKWILDKIALIRNVRENTLRSYNEGYKIIARLDYNILVPKEIQKHVSKEYSLKKYVEQINSLIKQIDKKIKQGRLHEIKKEQLDILEESVKKVSTTIKLYIVNFKNEILKKKEQHIDRKISNLKIEIKEYRNWERKLYEILKRNIIHEENGKIVCGEKTVEDAIFEIKNQDMKSRFNQPMDEFFSPVYIQDKLPWESVIREDNFFDKIEISYNNQILSKEDKIKYIISAIYDVYIEPNKVSAAAGSKIYNLQEPADKYYGRDLYHRGRERRNSLERSYRGF